MQVAFVGFMQVNEGKMRICKHFCLCWDVDSWLALYLCCFCSIRNAFLVGGWGQLIPASFGYTCNHLGFSSHSCLCGKLS